MATSYGVVTIDSEHCKGCGLCIIACPEQIIGFIPDTVNAKGYQPVVIEVPDSCTGCANCAIMCPDSVITVQRVINRRARDA